MGFAYKPIRFDDMTAVHTVGEIPGIQTSYEQIARTLTRRLPEGLILLDGFPTANFSKLIEHLSHISPGLRAEDVSGLYRPPGEIHDLLKTYLPLDREVDPELIFGRLFDQDFQPFFDQEKVSAFLGSLPDRGTLILYGLGSSSDLSPRFDAAEHQSAFERACGFLRARLADALPLERTPLLQFRWDPAAYDGDVPASSKESSCLR